MRFTHKEALELGNALLDAAELSQKCEKGVMITQTGSGRMIAIHGQDDCGTRYKVDPPIVEPDLSEVSIAS